MTHKTARTRSRLLDGMPSGPFDSPLNEPGPFTRMITGRAGTLRERDGSLMLLRKMNLTLYCQFGLIHRQAT